MSDPDILPQAPLGDEPQPAVEPQPDPDTDKPVLPEGQEVDADEQEEDSDEPEGEGEQQPKRKRPGKTARELARVTAQLAALQVQLSQANGGQKAEADPAQTEQPPKPEDFEDFEAYIVARTKHELRADQQAEQQKQQQTEAQREQAERASSFNQRTEAAREKYQDFDVIAFNPATPISEAMAAVVMDSEAGADLAYYLGSHADEAAKIAAMTPLQAARALGAIEAKLQAAPPPAKKTTKAPDPVKPLGGGDSPRKDPAKMSMSEYRAAREAGEIR